MSLFAADMFVVEPVVDVVVVIVVVAVVIAIIFVFVFVVAIVVVIDVVVDVFFFFQRGRMLIKTKTEQKNISRCFKTYHRHAVTPKPTGWIKIKHLSRSQRTSNL